MNTVIHYKVPKCIVIFFFFNVIKTLKNNQKNKIHFRWPLWCADSKQTHGRPMIEAKICALMAHI